jgi:hypothetical protein
MAGSPTASIVVDIIGTDSHDANDIESTMIDGVANIMNPHKNCTRLPFYGMTMLLLATSDCAYAQTIKELWVLNSK